MGPMVYGRSRGEMAFPRCSLQTYRRPMWQLMLPSRLQRNVSQHMSVHVKQSTLAFVRRCLARPSGGLVAHCIDHRANLVVSWTICETRCNTEAVEAPDPRWPCVR